jgi:hypothetical protein
MPRKAVLGGFGCFAAALLLAGGTAGRSAAHEPALQDTTTPDFAQQSLSAVNALRAKHGVPPLTLDPALTSYAEGRARIVSKSPDLSHRGLRPDLGEDLYESEADTDQPAEAQEAVDDWYSEIHDYRFDRPEPVPYSTLHFTQLVWRDTRRLGVARVYGRRPGSQWYDTYIIFDFSPAGNVEGRFRAEVPPPHGH